ncbi:hypothetical protein A8C56_00845 [Niabella ginsenosidivorans]|uniref:NlpC/P60 domain-containing protein n=1 Tax=Niabella ginsenosidivorans TaxID=1176587 RepID=A0A1A9HZG8_9BACT|nr:C40 family peptidase [Niabella ginsenosidivorans]ANH79714.1 hypothetical protein A8C56_00845 [Niabella ginsenosidivorans]
MKNGYSFLMLTLLVVLYSCSGARKSQKVNVLEQRPDPVESTAAATTSKKENNPGNTAINRSLDQPLDINRYDFVDYAKTFLGTPYKYGSADPDKGLDCSGLLYHIFQHYHVKSPRSSYDYENVGREVSVKKALPGDIILFTGENSRKIGHMGIVTENKDVLKFIHAPGSGTVVTIGRLSGYFEKHFVKIIRVLK